MNQTMLYWILIAKEIDPKHDQKEEIDPKNDAKWPYRSVEWEKPKSSRDKLSATCIQQMKGKSICWLK